jgi:hypothetical protein
VDALRVPDTNAFFLYVPNSEAEEREKDLQDQKNKLDHLYQRAVRSLKAKGAEIEATVSCGQALFMLFAS